MRELQKKNSVTLFYFPNFAHFLPGSSENPMIFSFQKGIKLVDE
jgi:hypothetical protein